MSSINSLRASSVDYLDVEDTSPRTSIEEIEIRRTITPIAESPTWLQRLSDLIQWLFRSFLSLFRKEEEKIEDVGELSQASSSIEEEQKAEDEKGLSQVSFYVTEEREVEDEAGLSQGSSSVQAEPCHDEIPENHVAQPTMSLLKAKKPEDENPFYDKYLNTSRDALNQLFSKSVHDFGPKAIIIKINDTFVTYYKEGENHSEFQKSSIEKLEATLKKKIDDKTKSISVGLIVNKTLFWKYHTVKMIPREKGYIATYWRSGTAEMELIKFYRNSSIWMHEQK